MAICSLVAHEKARCVFSIFAMMLDGKLMAIDWFKAIPGDALDTGAVLVTKGVEDAVEVWKGSDRLYHAWREDAEDRYPRRNARDE